MNPSGTPFVLVGGITPAKKSGTIGKTIPVCREQPFPGSYYNSNLIGGNTDAFISKIYYGECMTTDVFSPSSEFNRLDILPNPGIDYVTILLPEMEEATVSISLYDATGHELKKFKGQLIPGSNDPIRLEVAHIPAGLYYVIVQSKDKIFGGKFIKI